jgi:predicted nucleotidyltransferase
MTQDEIQSHLTPLYHRPNIVLVILFGSMATGVTHRRSDVDLAIQGSDVLDIVEMTGTVMRLLGDNRADVVDLRRASPLLAMEVARHGRVLYER